MKRRTWESTGIVFAGGMYGSFTTVVAGRGRVPLSGHGTPDSGRCSPQKRTVKQRHVREHRAVGNWLGPSFPHAQKIGGMLEIQNECRHKQELTIQMGWWGDMGGPKQKGIVQYCTFLL